MTDKQVRVVACVTYATAALTHWLSAVHRLAARPRQIDSRSRYDNVMLFRVPICGNAPADAAKRQGSVFLTDQS